jgi:hypothetical protein
MSKYYDDQIKDHGSQWSRSLRHDISSPARTLESWVRIPLEAWKSAHVYCVFALPRAGSGLATGVITA